VRSRSATLVLAGPLDAIPSLDSKTSLYFLPWAAAKSHFCFQGNHGLLSHKARAKYAFDFVFGQLKKVVRLQVRSTQSFHARMRELKNGFVGGIFRQYLPQEPDFMLKFFE